MGKDKTTTVSNEQQQTATSGMDQASQDYITQFLRPLAQQGADAVMNQESPFFNGPTSQFLQGLGGLQGVLGQLQGGGFQDALKQASYDPQGTGFTPGAIGDGGAMSMFNRIAGQSQGAGNLGFTAGRFDPSRAQEFFSPFENQVVGGIQANADRQREQAMNRAAQEATGSGAFGGSRSAMLQSQALRDVNQDEAAQVANVRNSGFQNAMQQALGAFGTEQATGLGAAQAAMQGRLQDRAGLLSAGMQAAGLGQQGQIAQNEIGLRNAMAGMQDRQFGANFDLNRAQSLQQGGLQGLAQQQQASQGLMAGGETLRGIQNQQGMENLFRFQNALGLGQAGFMGPLGQTNTSTGTNTQTQVQEGDLFGDIMGLGMMGAGLFTGGAAPALLGGAGNLFSQAGVPAASSLMAGLF